MEDLVRGEDARAGVLLETNNLDVRGAILEVHGSECVWRGLVAGLEDGHEILHVGDLGLAGLADCGVVCEGGLAAVTHAGDCGHAPEFRGVRHGLAAIVEKLGEGDTADLLTGSDDLGVLQLLEEALVHDQGRPCSTVARRRSPGRGILRRTCRLLR